MTAGPLPLLGSDNRLGEIDIDRVREHNDMVVYRPDHLSERIEREVPAVKLEKHPFIPTNSYYHAMAALRLDIGVAPLCDNRFNEAKSNLKYLEYSMFKVPTVASPVYPYARTITDGEDGILVKKNRHQEWLRQLTRLVENRAERDRLARNAFATVRDRFHLKTNVRRWLDLYRSLASRLDGEVWQRCERSAVSVQPSRVR